MLRILFGSARKRLFDVREIACTLLERDLEKEFDRELKRESLRAIELK